MVNEILVNKASTPWFETQRINCIRSCVLILSVALSLNFNRFVQKGLISLANLAILDNVSAKIRLWYLHGLLWIGIRSEMTGRSLCLYPSTSLLTTSLQTLEIHLMVRVFVLLVFPSLDEIVIKHLSVLNFILEGNTICDITRTLAPDNLVASIDCKVPRVRKVAKGQMAYRPSYPSL